MSLEFAGSGGSRATSRALPVADRAVRTTLVLGLGNILMQDEGLGVRAVERLNARYALPGDVRALDGGTRGLDLLPYLDGVTRLLILDAVEIGNTPGSLVRLEGESIPSALALAMSMHQVGVQELLMVSRLKGTMPEHIVVWGMQPGAIDWGLDLSPPVDAALDRLVGAAAGELREWGVAMA